MKEKNTFGKCYLVLMFLGILLLLLEGMDFQKNSIIIVSTCINLLIYFLILVKPEKTIGYILHLIKVNIKWTRMQILATRISIAILVACEIYYFRTWIEETYTFYYLNWKTIIGL